MFARLALDDEEDIFVRMVVAGLRETMPDEPYDEEVIRGRFQRYLKTANPTIFFAEHKRKVVGLVLSYMADFDYRSGFCVTQRLLYVSPENRGTRAAVVLMKELIRWGRSIGAAKIDGGNDNSFKTDRTARFLEHFGFKDCGRVMTLNLEERGDGQEG